MAAADDLSDTVPGWAPREETVLGMVVAAVVVVAVVGMGVVVGASDEDKDHTQGGGAVRKTTEKNT